MTPLFFALALFQSAPSVPPVLGAAAVDASVEVDSASPWDEDPIVSDSVVARATASEAPWSADEAATAFALCEAFQGAAMELLSVYEGEVQQEARLRLLGQIPGGVAGAERKDERALGHLEAAMATETGFMAVRVREMDGALTKLASALELVCP